MAAALLMRQEATFWINYVRALFRAGFSGQGSKGDILGDCCSVLSYSHGLSLFR